ncbi:response regulator receiver modulated diguanylate cyclase/phosphodiesterase [Roseibium hamelinense]|uniref:Response regulator receiver modulated diguanylate cyclase/phosphodiesterase n=1 Tax=Roseibium hamelinense TaxID=150831 RepID=A0A562SQ92_9HYPH|nr:diguanylate cyclase [Roseibium hamelinense]MTI44294.1 diguanylate cyclase [Roseibium hamelinense]TWI82930.1 response regulator receiver modulated diguanylate cyclase/phosphodiesterase [Roseibium hamelinense]
MNQPAHETKDTALGSVLIIDNEQADRARYCEILANYKDIFTEIIEASGAREALELIALHEPICCLLEYELDDGKALNFLKTLKSQFAHQTPAVIAISKHDTVDVAKEMLKAGAQDYLLKSEITARTLLRTIQYAIETVQLQQQMLALAHNDPLTGLLNRGLFMDRLTHTVLSAQRYGQECALLYIDIDHFKEINDRYGHEVGDAVLRTYATRLQSTCRKTDHCGRLGGDELVVLLPQITQHDALKVAGIVLKMLKEPIEIDGLQIDAAPSIGLAHCPTTTTDPEELLRQADDALYQAKKDGKSKFRHYTNSYQEAFDRASELKSELPEAIGRGELSLSYQKILRTCDSSLRGVEALCRWPHTKYDIGTDEIIQWVRDLRVEAGFNAWLFERAVAEFAHINPKETARNVADCTLTVNVSLTKANGSSIIDQISEYVERMSIAPQQIELDLSENDLARLPDRGRDFVHRLSATGFITALDNFGQGKFVLSDLLDLPIDVLKIQPFKRTEERVSAEKVKYLTGILKMAEALEKTVLVKGIETQSQWELVKTLGVNFGQGYFLGKPEEMTSARVIDLQQAG